MKVFIDTSAILPAFARWRSDPKVTKDSLFCREDIKRITLEKCVFECYMAFRGVGGKKPDEGRGDWARRQLSSDADPKSLDTLANTCHGQSYEMAHFWINNIDGMDVSPEQEAKESQLVVEADREGSAEDFAKFRILAHNRAAFASLCDELRKFLAEKAVEVVPYVTTFDSQWNEGDGNTHPCILDGLVRDTAIPSEDFEIVFTAMRSKCDLFVTEDRRLIRAAYSLGLNLPLCGGQFCMVSDFEQTLAVHRK